VHGDATQVAYKGPDREVCIRQAFANEIPPEIIKRKKRPFTTFYMSSIYRDEKPEFLHDVLSENAVREAGFFNYSSVCKLKKRIADPGLSTEQQTQLETPFSLVVTAQLWHQLFIKSFTRDGPSTIDL